MYIVVNSILLRELDEDKLIKAYAHLIYSDEEDVTDGVRIKENLKQLLDWDINGDEGLGIYCGKFEKLKESDWVILIHFIKEARLEIQRLSEESAEQRRLESRKVVNSFLERRESHRKEHFTNENYQVSGRGKKAKPCVYEGREYKSQQECMYKENITQYKLYKYLKETGQL